MIVEYPDRRKHDIEVKKVEQIESDGTYLIHGRENGRSVILHMKREGDTFLKIPETSMEYIRLSSPFLRKRNVTSEVKPSLDRIPLIGSTRYEPAKLWETKPFEAEERRKEEEPPKVLTASRKKIKVYVDGLAKYITMSAAYELSFEKGLTKEDYHKILSSDSSFILSSPSHLLTNEEFEIIKKNFEIEYVELKRPKTVERKEEPKPTIKLSDFHFGKPKETPIVEEKKEEPEPSHIEKEISNSLKELKELLKNNKAKHGGVNNIILFLLKRNQEIMKLEPGFARDCLFVELYHDLSDMKQFVQGRFFPERVLENLELKINALMDYLMTIGIDYKMTIRMLYNILEMLHNKNEREGNLLFDDIYETEILINGIIITVTSSKKEEIQKNLDSYMENNAHYNNTMDRLLPHQL